MGELSFLHGHLFFEGACVARADMYDLSIEDMDQIIGMKITESRCTYTRDQVGKGVVYWIYDDDKAFGHISG